MLKGNSNWKAMPWQLRVFIISTAGLFFLWWPVLSFVLGFFEHRLAYYFGVWVAFLITLWPWVVGGLYVAYKEWFCDEA